MLNPRKTSSNVCKICSNQKTKIVVNLGESPVANFFIKKKKDIYFKTNLILIFCNNCSNLQLKNFYNESDIFVDYSYLTPDTKINNIHYKNLIAYLLKKKYLKKKISIIEIGSNNGLFLKHLKKYSNDIIGVDPSHLAASEANRDDINTNVAFFDKKYIKKYPQKKNLIICRHVFAHNKNPNIFLKNLIKLMDKNSYLVIENAYSFDNFKKLEFDQIYNEHMFYYSLTTIKYLFSKHNLNLIDVRFNNTHGGSVCFVGSFIQPEKSFNSRLNKILLKESDFFKNFLLKKFEKLLLNKKKLFWNLLNKLSYPDKVFGGYGASAKSFTAISFLELNKLNLKFIIDTTAIKLNRYIPKFEIPILSEKELKKLKYDYIIVFSWNYLDDIIRKKKIFRKGTRLILFYPSIKIVDL